MLADRSKLALLPRVVGDVRGVVGSCRFRRGGPARHSCEQSDRPWPGRGRTADLPIFRRTQIAALLL